MSDRPEFAITKIRAHDLKLGDVFRSVKTPANWTEITNPTFEPSSWFGPLDLVEVQVRGGAV